MKKLDAKDRMIVAYLMHHPRAAVEEVSVRTGMPAPTVQKRLAYLLREQALERVVRVIDWTAVGYPLRYWIDVRINQRELRLGRGGPIEGSPKIDAPKQLAQFIMNQLAKRYEGSLIVMDVTMLLGSPADLSVYIRARDHRAVFEFVTGGLRMLGGVESTTTFHEAWSCTEGDLGLAGAP